MQHQQTILENGLRIITAERPQTETVSLGIWVKTGAAYETQEMNGISHFVEHMVFKGSKKRNSIQISEEIENVGGQNNAYTSREFTAFYAKMLKNDMELALDVIADFVLNPTKTLFYIVTFCQEKVYHSKIPPTMFLHKFPKNLYVFAFIKLYQQFFKLRNILFWNHKKAHAFRN